MNILKDKEFISMKPVTVRDLALDAGISIATVSRVLNNNYKVAELTRIKVINSARKLGYPLIPRSKQMVVAVILSGSAYWSMYEAMLQSTLTRELIERGYRVELVTERDIALLSERLVGGAISLGLDDFILDKWASLFLFPVVRLNCRSKNSENIYAVNADGITSMRKALKLLWENGHRKIGYLSGTNERDETTKPSLRYEGFIRAMKSYGVMNPEDYCVFNETYRHDLVPENIKKLLAKKVTALIVTQEAFALKAYYHLQQMGITIPEELSLITWELEDTSEFLNPPATTFSADFAKQCSCAIDMLEKLIRGIPVSDTRIPYRIIKRESVGPAPAHS